MHEETPYPGSHLFTLRVWREVLAEGCSEWRGQVRYLLTGETYYFRHWDQLPELLGRCCPELDPHADKRLSERNIE